MTKEERMQMIAGTDLIDHYPNTIFEDCAKYTTDETPEQEELQHPPRYTQGSIECWDYIIDKDMGYLEGNIIKYITRYKLKNGIEDLKKARNYLDKLIETVG